MLWFWRQGSVAKGTKPARRFRGSVDGCRGDLENQTGQHNMLTLENTYRTVSLHRKVTAYETRKDPSSAYISYTYIYVHIDYFVHTDSGNGSKTVLCLKFQRSNTEDPALLFERLGLPLNKCTTGLFRRLRSTVEQHTAKHPHTRPTMAKQKKQKSKKWLANPVELILEDRKFESFRR